MPGLAGETGVSAKTPLWGPRERTIKNVNATGRARVVMCQCYPMAIGSAFQTTTIRPRTGVRRVRPDTGRRGGIMTLTIAALLALAVDAGGGVAGTGAPLVRPALLASVAEDAATTGAAVNFRTASADRIIRRAYQDILGREPDPAGLRNYRRAILEEGWDEQDVRQALIRSPERRQQRIGASTGQAEDMVRRAYRSVLGREPDPSGMSHYTAKVLLEHWTEEDLVQALRDSDEYREKHR